ncbi:unnamed protein product [Ambrosiozyma monospora]|uniref:Unnamed protein product n=1 Tax=Ambrosiozyma monospora TaxID=43982 RepID=A0ACB5T8C6_AMBMO|nr:unnamed protein product [Ambrosiozyma monospora]
MVAAAANTSITNDNGNGTASGTPQQQPASQSHTPQIPQAMPRMTPLQQQVQMQQHQQQQQPFNGHSRTNSAVSAGQAQPGHGHGGPPSAIFSTQQSNLLKYQIAVFKKFIQNQPVTPDLVQVINYTYAQIQRQQQQQQQLNGQAPNQQQQPGQGQGAAAQTQQQLQQRMMAQRQAQLQQQQQQQLQLQKLKQQQQLQLQQQQQKQQQAELEKRKQAAAAQAAAAQQAQAQAAQAQAQAQAQAAQAQAQAQARAQAAAARRSKKSTPIPPGMMGGSPLQHPIGPGGLPLQLPNQQLAPGVMPTNPQLQQQQYPPKQLQPRIPKGLPPHPPLPLAEMAEKLPDVDVLSSENPMDVVDTYSVHKLPKDIPFDYFNTTKSKIITPSVYPKPLDLEQAKNIKMLVDQLELDAELADLKKLSDETKDIEYLLEFEALTLLPYQKAVKGHVLGSIYHQTLLLTNHLPNFSAKIRAVNLNDASISHALYTQQKVMAVQSQREKVVERQNNLLSASNDYKKFMNNRRINFESQ